ncbi:hypothetical protein ACIHDR_43310 [Nocardia sp. NPDC052278]|uniref:hypothetical protein n=1 Tax=unclassified Nocardia TaxID=2637762 RepID=UPI0036758D17
MTTRRAGRSAARGRTEVGGRRRVLHLLLTMAPNPAHGISPDPLGREPGDPLQHP